MLTQRNDFYNKLFVNILLIYRLDIDKFGRALKFDFFSEKYKKCIDKNVSVWYYIRASRKTCICGCSSMAEFQPSKLAVWVRFPSPASPVIGDFLCTFSSAG